MLDGCENVVKVEDANGVAEGVVPVEEGPALPVELVVVLVGEAFGLLVVAGGAPALWESAPGRVVVIVAGMEVDDPINSGRSSGKNISWYVRILKQKVKRKWSLRGYSGFYYR